MCTHRLGVITCIERANFFMSLANHLAGPRVIVTGDFNATLNKCDRTEQGVFSGRKNPHLEALVKACNLKDMWRAKNSEGSGHTLLYPKGSSRIDYVFATPECASRLEKVELNRVTFSDHACVTASFKLPSPMNERVIDKNIWKMNTTVLREQEFCQKLCIFIEAARKHPLRRSDKLKWWDEVFKLGVRKITVDYCRQRQQWKRATTRFFRTCLDEGIPQGKRSPKEHRNYAQMQRSFKEWEVEQNQGVIVRYRAQTTFSGENPSSYHVMRERRSKNATVISKLLLNSGKTSTSAEEIVSEIEEVYSRQFSEAIEEDETLDNLIMQHLDGTQLREQEAEELDRPISPSEAKQVLDKLKTNKAPGIDGIPIEFYKAAWEQIAADVTDNEILSVRNLTNSQKQGYVKLIPKTNSPATINEFRPITLLCADYKWLAAILARRLSQTLPSVLTEAQRGGMKNRKAEDVLALTRDLIMFMEEKQLQGAIATLDFAKAFDRVSRGVIWKIMRKFKYPETFIATISSLYNGVQAVIDTGEKQTRPLNCLNSVRQGCPLSVPLFLICIEPLLKNRCDPRENLAGQVRRLRVGARRNRRHSVLTFKTSR